MVLFTVALFIGGSLLLDHDLRNVASRLLEIEAEINRRADEFGIGKSGYVARGKEIVAQIKTRITRRR
jgi:hypothetical protein